jgi:DNA-binding NarL/FixJ family response regulator
MTTGSHSEKGLMANILDDSTEMRQALRSILHDCPGVQVVAEAANGEEAVSTVEKLQPDVVLMDINLPALNGIAATRAIKARHPHIAVVGLSANTPDNMVYAMVKAGAFAVVPKEKAVVDLYELMQKAVSSIPRDAVAGDATVTAS